MKDITGQVEERLQSEVQQDEPDQDSQQPTSGGPDDPYFVRQCLEHNERGDGILYSAVHGGKFIFNKTAGRWLQFNSHHWEEDTFDAAHNSVEDVALVYRKAADDLWPTLQEARTKLKEANAEVKACNALAKKLLKSGSDEELAECHETGEKAEADAEKVKAESARLAHLHKSYGARVDKLRSKTGVERTLYFSHIAGGLHLRSEDLDQHPMLLPCANGVIDLETGRLIDGKPDQYLMRAIPVEFHGVDRVNPDWRPFLTDIYDGDQDIVNFVRRVLGYCLTGLRIEHFIAVFVGDGRNGKGTLFEMVHDILGSLSWAIDPEMLLETKTPPNAASHSAHLASLRGRRLIVGSETDRNRHISSASVKRLTGGDMIKARAPNDRDETNFKPTHKLVLHTNDIPVGLTKDFALRERLILIPHNMLYVDNPEQRAIEEPHKANRFRMKDRTVPDRLQKDMPGILADLVLAALEWQSQGLSPPDKIKAAADEVHRDEDHLGRFLDVACEEDPEGRVAFKDFYAAFKKWYEAEVDDKVRYIQTKISIGKQLRSRGYTMPPAKETGGTQYVLDVRVRDLL